MLMKFHEWFVHLKSNGSNDLNETNVLNLEL